MAAAAVTGAGVDHLVLVGVLLDPDVDRGWISAGVPAAQVTRIVLDASDAELERRVRQREIGSGGAAQLIRTLAAARMFRARHPSEDHVLLTDGLSVAALAAEALRLAGWTAATPTSTAWTSGSDKEDP